MEKTFCVYMHINTVNGKRYIGQTCQKPVHDRWHSDGSGYLSNEHFTNAIKKYGWDAFEHIIILDGLTLQEADMAESLLIDMFDTMNKEKGYNKKHGGNNGFMSEEAKRRISAANSGKKRSAESLAKFSAARKGHEVSESTRAILREKCSGRQHTESERRAISEKNTGKHWYNNGVENAFCFECPDGFTAGMIFKDKETMAQKKREHFSRTKWYTDGVLNIRAIECPDGFRAGRTRKAVNE